MNEAKEELYAGLGYLFYSIAASDGHVSDEESTKLKKIVQQHWIPVEPRQDEVGTDLAYFIEIGYDYAYSHKLTPANAIGRFKEAHAAHPDLFDASTRNLVTRTAQAVADALGGRNQQERHILEQLKEVFS